MQKTKNILISPLNWGLGHATRCVPIINKHLLKGDRVIIATSGKALSFLKNEFPNCEFTHFKGFNVKYAKKPFFFIFLLIQLPLFGYVYFYERIKTKQLIKKYKLSLIISDNRYGVWNTQIKSILITHQIFLQLPKALSFTGIIINPIIKKLIENFDECHIPDFKEYNKSLAGNLSHGKPLPKNIKYIGPLSRFKNYSCNSTLPPSNIADILIIASGPEPHRTLFIEKIKNRFRNSQQKVLIISGSPNSKDKLPELNKGINIVSHLDTATMYLLIMNAKKIISISGYSTIMDLYVLKKSAELTPTPGQTEQEYLAKYYTKH